MFSQRRGAIFWPKRGVSFQKRKFGGPGGLHASGGLLFKKILYCCSSVVPRLLLFCCYCQQYSMNSVQPLTLTCSSNTVPRLRQYMLEELVSRGWNSRRCVGSGVVAYGFTDSPGARPVKVTHARRAEIGVKDRRQCPRTTVSRSSVTPRQRFRARRIPRDAHPSGITHRRHTHIQRTRHPARSPISASNQG